MLRANGFIAGEKVQIIKTAYELLHQGDIGTIVSIGKFLVDVEFEAVGILGFYMDEIKKVTYTICTNRMFIGQRY